MNMHWLSVPRAFFVKGSAKSIGGPGAVTQEILTSCLSHLKNWGVLVREGILSEFPSHEIMRSNDIFDTICLEHLPLDLVQKPLRRFASAFTLDHTSLQSQFCSDWPYVRQLYLRAAGGKSVDDCWSELILLRDRADHHDLSFVLCRKVCWAISSSGLEQDLSKAAHCITERSLALTGSTNLVSHIEYSMEC